ncbi:hypothetical protein MMC11_008197 [Xylographa trunciseda]|nr:hypothetical protein [Xylographa trunciseda]
MSQSDLLVITSASGKQATQLLPFLPTSLPLRLVCHSEVSAHRLRSLHPNAEVLIGDLSSPSFCASILKDATALYHIGPSFHPFETTIGLGLVQAASKEHSTPNGLFRHFVYSSVLHSSIRKMLNHDCKRYVEEALLESGVPYTILQPTHFMEMVPVAKLAQEKGNKVVFPAKWDPSIGFSFVALKDLGEVGAKVLREGQKHYSASYEICGTGPVSYSEVMKIVGQKIGKEVVAEQVGLQEAVDGLMKILFGGSEEVHSYTRDSAERMLLYYNRRGLVGNPNVLEWLLGRKPTSVSEWVEAQAGKYK